MRTLIATAIVLGSATAHADAKDQAAIVKLFVVFDKVGGAWSVVHVHFAVPAP